jgi:hypothetical protein
MKESFPRKSEKMGLKHNAAEKKRGRKVCVHTFFSEKLAKNGFVNFVNGKNPLKNPLNIFYFLQCKYDNVVVGMWKILAPTRVCQ